MMLHILIPVLVLSGLYAGPDPVLQSPRATYGAIELQQWADQLTKMQGVPGVSVELSSDPVLLSTSILPGKVLLNASYLPHRLSVEEAKAALAREVVNLKIAAGANKDDLVQWPRLFGTEPTFSHYGMLSVQGRIRAMDDSLALLTKIEVSPVAMLTLHEVEAQEIAKHLPIIEGLLTGKWSDLMAGLRKRVSQVEDPPRRSAVSNFFRVRTMTSDVKTAFWFRETKLFELSFADAALLSEISKGLNTFFDSGLQPLQVRTNGTTLLVGKMVLQFESTDAAIEARQQVIQAVSLWRKMASG